MKSPLGDWRPPRKILVLLLLLLLLLILMPGTHFYTIEA